MGVVIDAKLVKFSSEVGGALGNMYSEVSSLSNKLSSIVGVNNKTKSMVESSYKSANQLEIYGKFDEINAQYEAIQTFVNSSLNSILSMASSLVDQISVLEEYVIKIQEAERRLISARSRTKKSYPYKATKSQIAEINSYNSGIDAEIQRCQEEYDKLVGEFEEKHKDATSLLQQLQGNDPAVSVSGSSVPITSSFSTSGNGTFQTYSYNGLNYYMYIPENKDVTPGLPVTVYLHGKGENSISNLTKNALPKLLKEGMQTGGIVICPVSRDGKWQGKDLDKTKELLDLVVSNYNADTTRISLAGYSNGAIGAYKMAIKYPDTFSCVVPIAGEYWEGEKGVSLLAQNKIWAFHGNKDVSFKIDEVSKKWKQIADAGGTIDASVYDAGHGGKEQIATKVFKEKVKSDIYTNGEEVYLLDWMQSQVKN